MNPKDCGTVRELIPDVARMGAVAENLRRVELHAATCEECRAELDLVRMLHATRPEPRLDLVHRIERRLRLDRQALQRPWWGLTAAAVAALALGIGFSSGPGGEIVAPAFALEAEDGLSLDTEDGLIAGGIVFDELSDDALGRLLEALADDAGGA